jgi:hypothetical protein
MKPDFLITFRFDEQKTLNQQVRIEPMSKIGGALLSFYYGELPDENDYKLVDFISFKHFKSYCDEASANRFQVVFVIESFTI